MKFLITIFVLVCVAYAQDSTAEAEDLSMPEVVQRVTLDDLRYTLKVIAPEMKQRLESYLKPLGMNIADVEQALDNPTEEIKEKFGPSGMSIKELKTFIGKLPEPVKQMFESEKEL